MIAFWCAWHIVNNPDTTILYASDTIKIAAAQLGFIKGILTSKVLKKYWPDLISEKEMQREKWTNEEIAVDHWRRQEFGIRDMTIQAAGIGTSITGLHYDVIILDDVVVLENSQSEAERAKVETWYSLLSSIKNTDSVTKAVGTRYHPKDLYNSMMDMMVEIYDGDGNGEVIREEPVYTVSTEVVEVDSEYLWPRQMVVHAGKQKWYGFNKQELAKKRAEYLDVMQFYAQYYNDPNDPANANDMNFQYYDKKHLGWEGNHWTIKGRRLNVYAAIDFATTINKRSDYTAIGVIGIDYHRNIFVLAIDRFKTQKISVMCDHLDSLYDKWKWLKLLAEVDGQQNLVVEQVKDTNRDRGVYYTVEKVKHSDDKTIRTLSILEPRYAAGQLYHYRGGNCQVLEDEITMARPPHDDVRDVIAGAVSVCKAPSPQRRNETDKLSLNFNSQFGGVAR
jgi:phage terminase large subunit-like protein